MLSALTPPLHCASIPQPATPPQVVAFESWTILLQFVSIVSLLLNHGNRSLNLCVCFIFPSSNFAFLIEINFSFKSLFRIWSLLPQPLIDSYPCLRVYVAQIYVDLSSRFLGSTVTFFTYHSFLTVSEILNYSDTCAVPSVCNAVGLLILLKLCPVFTFLQQLMTK